MWGLGSAYVKHMAKLPSKRSSTFAQYRSCMFIDGGGPRC